MSSEKLRKYLAYYQRVLKAEPENIEARLRLAAIFRELGRTSHAVDEYVTASKLLAKEGLPLEAIAACKAVLELEPDNTEIKYFLARLFALVPEAMGQSSRVAQPLDSTVLRQTPSQPREAIEVEAPITLKERKGGETTRNVDVVDEAVWEHEKPTQHGAEVDELAGEVTSPFEDEGLEEDTSPLDSESEDDSDDDSEDDVTREVEPIDDATAPRMDMPEFDAELDDEDLDAHSRTTRPIRPLNRAEVEGAMGDSPTFETFEVNVFDMESLGLDEESSEIDLTFLEDFDGEVGEFTANEVSESYPAVFKVEREELPEIPLLSQLPAHVFMRLLGVIDLQRVPSGTIILRPDNTSRALYIVVHGETTVTRLVDGEEVQLATMTEGEFFGEFMLLTGRTGDATVRARTDCELLVIHESVVNDIADEYPEIWDVLWDFYYARMLNNLLASSDIFRPLEMAQRQALADRFRMQEIVADEVFLAEGEPCRDLYLVLSGEVRAERRVAGSVEELATMREGEFFGLASSLNDEPYLADLRAMRDTTLLMLPSEEFRAVTDRHPEVSDAVELAIMSRRALNDAFKSGITAYAEHGVASFD